MRGESRRFKRFGTKFIDVSQIQAVDDSREMQKKQYPPPYGTYFITIYYHGGLALTMDDNDVPEEKETLTQFLAWLKENTEE